MGNGDRLAIWFLAAAGEGLTPSQRSRLRQLAYIIAADCSEGWRLWQLDVSAAKYGNAVEVYARVGPNDDRGLAFLAVHVRHVFINRKGGVLAFRKSRNKGRNPGNVKVRGRKALYATYYVGS